MKLLTLLVLFVWFYLVIGIFTAIALKDIVKRPVQRLFLVLLWPGILFAVWMGA